MAYITLKHDFEMTSDIGHKLQRFYNNNINHNVSFRCYALQQFPLILSLIFQNNKQQNSTIQNNLAIVKQNLEVKLGEDMHAESEKSRGY